MLFLKSKKRNKTIQEENVGKEQLSQLLLNGCEEMMEATKELEEQKQKYKVVTEYLNDIQFIEDLPEKEKERLKNSSDELRKLELSQSTLSQTKRKISESQFAQMKSEESVIPEIIEKLKKNESYQAMIIKDMKHLEGEKLQWQFQINHGRDHMNRLKQAVIILFVFLGLSTLALFFISNLLKIEVFEIWMVVLLFSGLMTLLVYLRQLNQETKIRQSYSNRNYVVVLLNKIKFKYVHITNAVDFICEKYHVTNSREFLYVWEQYSNEVKERKKYQKLSLDTEYAEEKLRRILLSYPLFDREIWLSQSYALGDKKEMVELKHELIERRQKIRTRIETIISTIQEWRKEIDTILSKENLYTPEIREVLRSIEKMTGME